MRIQTILLLCFLSATNLFAQKDIRVKEKFDTDWKFILDDKQEYANELFNDGNWNKVDLPHDWNISQPFEEKYGGSTAFLPEGIGWYRKTFILPKSFQGKQISILFDGIFHQSDVYLNGKHLGFRPYGFCSIEYDLTPYLHSDKENTLAVRVDCTGERPRWYAGSGIYRHTWLQAVNPVHIKTYGTFVSTRYMTKNNAVLELVSTIVNSSDESRTISILQEIKSPSGKPVGQTEDKRIPIPAGETIQVKQVFNLPSPRFWSVDTPQLYELETLIAINGKITDRYTTPFGVRTTVFDKDKGFLLNGEPVKLKGMCLHQDAGSFGVAVPYRSNERRLEILKEYGCNAIRCAHNPPSPELLDLCDRLGFIVIDEALDKWKSGYYEKYFDEWWQKDIENMVLRDRNHPSVVLWSIGNEVQEAWDSTNVGVERAKMLQDFVHSLDATRQVTLAAQNRHQEHFAGVTDVIGYNYLEARLLSDRKKFPERIFVVSEELPYFRGEEGRIRSYTPLNPWEIVANHDFIAGGFIWSGVDYLGEASRWPSKGWPNGLFDICMFEKPRAAYHRAMWNPEPMVRIAVVDASLDIDHGRDLWQWPKMAAHWNFPERYEEMIMEVRTTTNCDSVEIYLNGDQMGKQATADFTNNTIVWYLPYKPGKLEAVGYKGNREVARHALITSKETAKAKITPDRTMLKADGEDVLHITVELEDEDGHFVQTDDRKVSVAVEGEAKLIGIDNGDLRRERFCSHELKTYFGKALILVQSTRILGKATIRIKIEGTEDEQILQIPVSKE